MTYQIAVKKAEGVERLLSVTVPADTMAAAEEKVARRYTSQVRLPGFRPGKAPAAMVRKQFAQQIKAEALDAVLQEVWQAAVEQEKLEPVAQPRVTDLHVHDGEPVTMEIAVEVRPQIELAKTEGFALVQPPAEVTDAMVQEQLDQLLEQRAAWAPVEEKPQPGDQVRVSIATAEEGQPLPDAREFPIEIGKGQAIAGIEELIMEATPGQTVERAVRWPDDFPDEAQRGKAKQVRVTLLDVKRRTMPVLDDAFAAEIGDFDSVEALRTAVRTDMAAHYARESESQVRGQLLDQVIEANPFDVPKAWVQQLVQAYGEMYKITPEQQEQFVTEFTPMAERQVRRDVIIDTLAEREGLAATTADVDEKVAALAGERNVEPGQLYVQLEKAGRLKELERTITDDKVFAWLLARSTVTAAS
ncbi:MAG: trigger factor [Gemmatimonadaceae bacterium]|jgi:trigger factor|nr:trigger factor [Gemmatimonadaceae bacterium]